MNPLLIASSVWMIAKKVITNPLVDKALDNFFAGTSNRIDDAVWAALEFVARMGLPEKDAEAEVVERLAAVQRQYDDMTSSELEACKSHVTEFGVGFNVV